MSVERIQQRYDAWMVDGSNIIEKHVRWIAEQYCRDRMHGFALRLAVEDEIRSQLGIEKMPTQDEVTTAIDNVLDHAGFGYTQNSEVSPGIYRHYKGGLYEILGIAIDEASIDDDRQRHYVVYRPYIPVDDQLFSGHLGASPTSISNENAVLWIRELWDFCASPAGLPRFTKVST